MWGWMVVERRRGWSFLWWPELRWVIGEGGGASLNLSHGMADLGSYGNANRDIEQQVRSFSLSLSLYVLEVISLVWKVQFFSQVLIVCISFCSNVGNVYFFLNCFVVVKSIVNWSYFYEILQFENQFLCYFTLGVIDVVVLLI